MNKKTVILILLLVLIICPSYSQQQAELSDRVIEAVRKGTIEKAEKMLAEKPVTVTASLSKRSAGGKHDFYSEGDYWWPDPANPNGPYIQKDGQSNPDNFSDHRHAMIRFSEITATLTSAWLLTGERKFANKALEHLNAWFVDTATRMNPNMLYAQAIWGRFTGRGIGLIDAYHLVEIVQSAEILIENRVIPGDQAETIKAWFRAFLGWMTTHQYGIDEMHAENNHGTCWIATASALASVLGDEKIRQLCVERFKTVLLPGQMAADGSFPLELKRTKPYGYSLFNIDAMCNVAEILSVPDDNLWDFKTTGGLSLKKGLEYIYPFIVDKSKWPFAKDIYIWEEWPVRQSALLFAGLAYSNRNYIDTYLAMKDNSLHPEVIRNLPVRHPVIWILKHRPFAQPEYPHILVTDNDKQTLLEKIRTQSWAKTIYDELQSEVNPYVNRHTTDPQWILSRYLMHRVPGKRYTHSYADNNGQRILSYSGDAPVPTVRVSTYLRSPITEKGTAYRRPTIEELVPNDTSSLMYLYNPETDQKEWIDPRSYITAINGEINRLALNAAILYWLTGEDKYAVFAADILDQWAKGAYYQEPIVGPCRTGFLDMQTLGDQSHRSLILAYDFLKPFMKQKGYELKWYEVVFEKFASTLAFRGYWNNNWYAAESSTLVFAALSLENKQKQDYYLQFVLERDTINGSCGQLAFPSTVEKWLTHDGHWKEPGGYHNYPVNNLLIAALALEKNGHDIFRRFPALFQASYAMLKYSFPNLVEAGFGDTGHASQSAESLEIGLTGAVKYNSPALPEMLASMKKLTDGGKYNRERSGFLGLLCFLPQIPEPSTVYQWPRTGQMDFARYYLQRNGMDPVYGLMIGVQGATYNHNHCNGMSMELYGLGEVLGLDPGTGPNYEHPMHRNYYSQWAAHNTVAAAGMSSSVPFSGSAGTKNIGQIELAAMEPLADKQAVSENYSFTDTRYFDKSTNTNQARTLAIVRKSPTSGYYVDIFRSDNKISNDYVYHNIGENVSFLNEKREPLQTVPATYPVTEKDYPGFRFFTDVHKLENETENVIARFPIKDGKSDDLFLQALISGSKDRVYFSAFSPKSKSAGQIYSGKPLPLFTIRTEKEAQSNPFVVVFEPYKGAEGNTVENIAILNKTNNATFTLLEVTSKDKSKEIIFQSVDPQKLNYDKYWAFKGNFGIAGLEQDKITSLYLGHGKELTYRYLGIVAQSSSASASVVVKDNKLIVSCTSPVKISVSNKKFRSYTITYLQDNKKHVSEGKAETEGSAKIITVPAVIGAEIEMK